jgi:hypothetical protein
MGRVEIECQTCTTLFLLQGNDGLTCRPSPLQKKNRPVEPSIPIWPGCSGRPEKRQPMGYQPFTNDYTPIRTPTYVANELAARTAVQSRVNDIITGGNLVMGNLVTECCSDPNFAGQGFYDDSSSAAIASLVPGTPAATPLAPLSGPSTASGSPPAVLPFPLTPVDILSGSWGWQGRANQRPWARPRLSAGYQRKLASAYPNYGAGVPMRSLVPPCPCFGSGPPVVIPVPQVQPNPSPNPAAGTFSNCPYPGCSTGNVCLDLITGCVSNSQVTQAQVEACTEAGYSTFGNSGTWLPAILLGCGGNLPYLGAPMPNPPQATGSMENILAAANAAGAAASSKARGMGGLGQDDSTSNVGGFLAVVGVFGMLVWALKK